VGEPINVRSLIHALAAMLHALRGEREAAVAEARARVAMHPPGRGPWALWMLNEYAARVAVACGDTPLLRECLREMTALQSVELVQRALQRTPLHRELPGHLAWHEGRAEEACALWQAALEHEAQIDGMGTLAHLRVWLAHGLLSLGRRAEAAQALQPVFARVAEDGEPGGVLLAPRALPALADADWGALLDPLQQRMLQDWRALALSGLPSPGASSTPGKDTSGAPSIGAGLLSPREAEVLARIAAGDSNKLIARAFDLSPHTVKRHVANILDKLGLASRGQAAAWWRDHA